MSNKKLEAVNSLLLQVILVSNPINRNYHISSSFSVLDFKDQQPNFVPARLCPAYRDTLLIFEAKYRKKEKRYQNFNGVCRILKLHEEIEYLLFQALHWHNKGLREEFKITWVQSRWVRDTRKLFTTSSSSISLQRVLQDFYWVKIMSLNRAETS